MLVVSTGCASLKTVDEGRLYRSGQLTPKQLEQVIAKHDIKTVVNLRGPQPAARWYRAEQQVCQQAGARMVDIALDATAPERGEIAALLETYHSADSPILVHSWSPQGSVGLATGLYRAAILEDSNEAARKELAPWMSARWPIRQLSEHDRFLKEWQGERDFFATYQLAGRDDLPELEADRTVALRQGMSSPSYSPAPGSALPLPAPALELFDADIASSKPVESPSLVQASQDDSSPADVRLSRPVGDSTSKDESPIQAVVWLGAPVEIVE